MNSSDDDYDAEREFDDVDEDSVEAKVWQLLLLINPGDGETALLQFNDYREVTADVDADEVEPIEVIGRVIDWRSGFIVGAHDLRSLVQAINELSSRWNLSVDWNGDPDDDEFFDDADSETVATIKDLIETRVRPAVAGDGGDITFRGFREGVVFLQMKGACSGCPSSTATLQHGIQNLLRHFVPEVTEVRPI